MKNIVHDGTATLQSWTNHLQMELKVVDKVKLGGVVLATCSSGLLHLKKNKFTKFFVFTGSNFVDGNRKLFGTCKLREGEPSPHWNWTDSDGSSLNNISKVLPNCCKYW